MGSFLETWSAVAGPLQPAPTAQAEPKVPSWARLNRVRRAIAQEPGEGLGAFFWTDLQARARASPVHEHIFPGRKSPS